MKNGNETIQSKIFASILVILSGAILFLDKIINVELSNNYGYEDSQTFIWVLCQTLSPVLLILGAVIKPFITSYTIPLYFLSIQLIWVFNPSIQFDDSLLHTYALGCVGFSILTFFVIKGIIKKQHELSNSKDAVIEKLLNLSIELTKRSSEKQSS